MSRYKFTNGKLVLLNIVDQSTAEYQELQNAVLSSIPKFLQKVCQPKMFKIVSACAQHSAIGVGTKSSLLGYDSTISWR